MYYVRIVADGDTWLCKRGSRGLARFDTVIDAVDLTEAEAATHAPSQVLYHGTDGEVRVIGSYDKPGASPFGRQV